MEDGNIPTGGPRLPWEAPVITDSRVVGVTRSGSAPVVEGEDGDDPSTGTAS